MRIIRKILYTVVFLIAAGTLFFSGCEIVSILRERHVSKTVNAEINKQAVIMVETEKPTVSLQDNTDAYRADTEATEETEPPKETAPVVINFEYLHEINDDVAGWIYSEDTPISYPFLQSEDNSYYLYRLIDGAQNPSGSLFLDFRNQFDMSDWNSIIYGHNMGDGSMFASLNAYKRQEYYEAHPVMYLLTPENEYKIELIAGIMERADATFYDFPVPEERREEVIEGWLENSTFETHAEILEGDRFVTLSTCTYEFENARYVVIGVLREIEK